MVVNFDDAHRVAHGDEDSASQYSNMWRKPTPPCQLIVCVTGTSEYILQKLEKMVSELKEFGKPAQGQTVTNNGDTIEVMTPVWDGDMLISLEELSASKDEGELHATIGPLIPLDDDILIHQVTVDVGVDLVAAELWQQVPTERVNEIL